MSFNVSSEVFAKLLREKAIACDPEFQYRVGNCYYQGVGVDINHTEDVKWYRLAAEQGHAKAQNNLGYAYQKGLGIAVDIKEAIKWYERSAKQGEATAQVHLGVCYINGEGVTQNIEEGVRLLELAADQCFWRGSLNLGEMYLTGVGVERDLKKAKEYFEKAKTEIQSSDPPRKKAKCQYIDTKIEEICVTLGKGSKEYQTEASLTRAEVFVSYAHEDRSFLNELKPHLNMLSNIAEINYWDDTCIKGGQRWDDEIKNALSRAKVAVLLISANFFSSSYIWRKEFPEILKSAKQNGTSILWLPIRSCMCDGTGILEYQSVIDPKKPLALHDAAEHDVAYTKLIKEIKNIFKI
jgi:hypothetical protein